MSRDNFEGLYEQEYIRSNLVSIDPGDWPITPIVWEEAGPTNYKWYIGEELFICERLRSHWASRRMQRHGRPCAMFNV